MTTPALPVITAEACRNCGACCEHMGTPPAMFAAYGGRDSAHAWAANDRDQAIWEAMPESLRDELRAYNQAAHIERSTPDRVLLGMPCLWYDEQTRACRHYEHRPTACRDFEAGGEMCLTTRDWLGRS